MPLMYTSYISYDILTLCGYGVANNKDMDRVYLTQKCELEVTTNIFRLYLQMNFTLNVI